MFATRHYGQPQELLSSALRQHGRPVVIYGVSGVGKTSLVRYVCTTGGKTVLRVDCGRTFDEMATGVLAAVGERRAVETTKRVSGEGEAGVSIWHAARARVKASAERETKSVPYEAGPTALLFGALRGAGIGVLFFDNFENLLRRPYYEDTARAIAELMKAFADQSADFGAAVPHVFVAGIPQASAALLTLDDATERRTVQIEVPRMAPDEINQILVRGEQKLGIRFDEECRDRIIDLSDGFPYYTHLYGLHCARSALAAGRAHVTTDDFDSALGMILAECRLKLTQRYEAAIESGGEVQMRRSVLEAFAQVGANEASLQDIRRSFEVLYPESATPERLRAVGKTVRSLKVDYGILADRNRPRSSANRYRFVDPLMRAYVRLKREERQRDARRALKASLPWDA